MDLAELWKPLPDSRVGSMSRLERVTQRFLRGRRQEEDSPEGLELLSKRSMVSNFRYERSGVL